MASDIKITWNPATMQGDFTVTDGDLDLDGGLTTAVKISLFTDRQARLDDPYENNDRRGWWGDQTSSISGDQIGSRLWLLERAKTTSETIRLAKGYIEEALQWMIDDGVAKKVEVTVERAGRPGNDRLYFKVTIRKSDGNDVTYKFDDLWENQMAS